MYSFGGMSRLGTYTYTYYGKSVGIVRTVAQPNGYTSKQHGTPQPTTDRVEVLLKRCSVYRIEAHIVCVGLNDRTYLGEV